MREAALVLLLLVSSPAAADCSPPLFSIGSSGLATGVANEDRRELVQLLGTQLDHVVCGRMRRTDRYIDRFVVKQGFFVLTKDEVLFVGDRKVKKVLLRVSFGDVRKLDRTVWGLGVDNTLSLDFSTGAGGVELELTCAGGARRVVDELQRRVTGSTGLPARRSAFPQYSCD